MSEFVLLPQKLHSALLMDQTWHSLNICLVRHWLLYVFSSGIKSHFGPITDPVCFYRCYCYTFIAFIIVCTFGHRGSRSFILFLISKLPIPFSFSANLEWLIWHNKVKSSLLNHLLLLSMTWQWKTLISGWETLCRMTDRMLSCKRFGMHGWCFTRFTKAKRQLAWTKLSLHLAVFIRMNGARCLSCLVLSWPSFYCQSSTSTSTDFFSGTVVNFEFWVHAADGTKPAGGLWLDT